MIMHDSNSSIQEVEAGGSEGQYHFLLHTEFEASLGYVMHCLKRKIWNILSKVNMYLAYDIQSQFLYFKNVNDKMFPTKRFGNNIYNNIVRDIQN